jgi:hypothetical protein
VTTSVFYGAEKRLVDFVSDEGAGNGPLTVKQLYDNLNTAIDTGVTLVQQINNSATSTNPNATFTNTPTNGNAMIAILCRAADNVASTGPSGWVQLTAQGAAGSRRLEIWWKRAGASEAKLHTWTNATSALWDLTMIEYGGIAATIDPVVVVAAANMTTNTTQTFAQSGFLPTICAIATGGAVTNFTNTGTNIETVTDLPFTTTGRFRAMNLDPWTNRESGQTNTISWTTSRAFTRAQVGWNPGTNDNDSTNLDNYVGNNTQTSQTIGAQMGLRFDTSALPNNDTVDTATISIRTGPSAGSAWPANSAVNAYSLAAASITASNSNTRAAWKKPSELAALTKVASRAAGASTSTGTVYTWTSESAFTGQVNKTGDTTILIATADQQAGTYRTTSEFCVLDPTAANHYITVVHSPPARTVAATLTATPAITRTVAYLRTIAATLTTTPAIARTVAYLRTVAADLAVTPTITTVQAYARSITATITATPAIARAITFARSITATITGTVDLAATLIPFSAQVARIVRLAGRSTLKLTQIVTARLGGRSTIRAPKE